MFKEIWPPLFLVVVFVVVRFGFLKKTKLSDEAADLWALIPTCIVAAILMYFGIKPS